MYSCSHRTSQTSAITQWPSIMFTGLPSTETMIPPHHSEQNLVLPWTPNAHPTMLRWSADHVLSTFSLLSGPHLDLLRPCLNNRLSNNQFQTDLYRSISSLEKKFQLPENNPDLCTENELYENFREDYVSTQSGIAKVIATFSHSKWKNMLAFWCQHGGTHN